MSKEDTNMDPAESRTVTMLRLLDSHWSYVEEMLFVHGQPKEIVEMAEFHYKNAFRHGWKHCEEEFESKFAGRLTR